MRHAWILGLLAACDLGDASPSFEIEPMVTPNTLAERVAIVRMFVQGRPVLDELNPGLPKDRSTVSHEALATEYGQRVADHLHHVSADLTYISGLIRINDPSYD